MMIRRAVTVKPWGRGRLLAVLAGMVVVAVGLLAGFGLAIWSVATRSDAIPAAPTPTRTLPSDQARRRDMLAAEPMLQVNGTDSIQGVPAATPGPMIGVPNSSLIGPAKVPTGFPHTPEGAIGQLAAIEVSVLTEMSIPRTNEIYHAWSAAAMPVDQWRLTRHVQAFLAATKMGQTMDPAAQVTVIPAAAQTKATDGPDWTIACVLIDVRAVIHSEARMAYGYCERLQ